MKKERVVFAILFLVLMVLFNTASLHIFMHDHHEDDNCVEQCIICDVALEMQSENFLPLHITQLNVALAPVVFEKQIGHRQEIVTTNTNGHPFCRPPPCLL